MFNDTQDYGENPIKYVSRKLVLGSCFLNDPNRGSDVEFEVTIPNRDEEVQGTFKCKVFKEYDP